MSNSGVWDLDIAGSGSGSEIENRLKTLEETIHEYEIYHLITEGTTGSVEKPTHGDIIMDQYPAGGDCIVVQTDSTTQKPIEALVYDASGVLVEGTLDINGNYTLSGVPAIYPVALVFQVSLAEMYKTLELSNDRILTEMQIPNAVITSHEDLSNINQAGTGVVNGHISDQAQTIEGAKTFSDTIIGSINGNADTVTNGVYTIDDQTIAGVKTFSSSPIVPNATTATQAVNYGQVVKNTGNETVAGVKTFSSSPIVPTPASNSYTTVPATTAWVTDRIEELVVDTATQALAIKPLGNSITLEATPTSETRIIKIATVDSMYSGLIKIVCDGSGIGDVIKVYIDGGRATDSGIRVTYGKHWNPHGIKKIIVTFDAATYDSNRQIYAEIVTRPNYNSITELGVVETNTGTFTPSMTEVSSIEGTVVDSLSLDYHRGDISSYQHEFTKNIIGNLTGNAATATKLANARTITIAGDATGSTTFDGSANKTITLNVAKATNATNATTATNAATATKLANARTITIAGDATGSTTFDGSANKTITLSVAKASNADTATKLANARTITIAGDATGSTTFDGSANKTITLNVTKATNATNATTAITAQHIPTSDPGGVGAIWLA